jgi:arsenical-resistance protein 2
MVALKKPAQSRMSTTTDSTTAPGAAPAPTAAAATPWYAAYPAPKSEVVTISREEVLFLLRAAVAASPDEENQHQQQGQGKKRDFVLVDLRRNDFEGGTIRGSVNLPAQSLPLTLPAVYALFKQAGVKKVIFYCGRDRFSCLFTLFLFWSF